ncbi:ImmA/IrrE family metallo-endopeptidase [Staphylococcus nepalensis]|uniref:ImmA/IrrE family metallo-endopeptidase n=1 Tax=Staphylococcus nepalensis TaxID=214473 RepID=UPI0031BAF6DE
MFIDDVVNDLAYELNSNNIEKTIEGISDYLSIIVVYNEHISCVMKFKGYHVIYIKQDEKNKMWEDFTHELGHFMLHDTDQRNMNDMYNQKQENEANKFSLLFRMPQKEIELHELFTENDLMTFYEVGHNIARQRLISLCNYYCNEETRVFK